ncbi:MAG: GAF domain-containing protein, partial [Rudaea sp.]
MNPRVPFWSSLRVRVMLGVLIPLTLVLAAAAEIQTAIDRDLLLKNLAAFSLSIGDSVETGLTQAMLNQDRQGLAESADALTRRGSIRRVLIVDRSGIVRVASPVSQLGNRLSVEIDSARSFVVDDPGGSRSWRSIKPIENTPACQGCHASGERFNGALVIDLPYESIEAHLRADLLQNLGLSAAAILLVSLAINLLLNRMVLARLERFRDSLAHFARGDFSIRVPVSGRDEVAELAGTVNAMADGLEGKARLEEEVERGARELERRAQRLDALYRVALESSRSLNLEQVMQAGLQSALAATAMEAGEIRLDTPNRDRLRIRAFLGSPPKFIGDEEQIRMGECLCGRVGQQGDLYVRDQIRGDPQATRHSCLQHGLCSLAAVPLKARGQTVGVISLHSSTPRQFSPDDEAMLKALGEQLGIAIDNARLYGEMEVRVTELSRRVQRLAVTEERVRLAREMHDGFAQALSVLNLKIRVLKGESSSPEGSGAQLDEMQQIVSETYEDVRQSISDLRTPVSEDGCIVGMLRDYIQNFSLRYQLQAQISASPDALAASCATDASP